MGALRLRRVGLAGPSSWDGLEPWMTGAACFRRGGGGCPPVVVQQGCCPDGSPMQYVQAGPPVSFPPAMRNGVQPPPMQPPPPPVMGDPRQPPPPYVQPPPYSPPPMVDPRQPPPPYVQPPPVTPPPYVQPHTTVGVVRTLSLPLPTSTGMVSSGGYALKTNPYAVSVAEQMREAAVVASQRVATTGSQGGRGSVGVVGRSSSFTPTQRAAAALVATGGGRLMGMGATFGDAVTSLADIGFVGAVLGVAGAALLGKSVKQGAMTGALVAAGGSLLMAVGSRAGLSGLGDGFSAEELSPYMGPRDVLVTGALPLLGETF